VLCAGPTWIVVGGFGLQAYFRFVNFAAIDWLIVIAYLACSLLIGVLDNTPVVTSAS
jgi:hypothetical protein